MSVCLDWNYLLDVQVRFYIFSTWLLPIKLKTLSIKSITWNIPISDQIGDILVLTAEWNGKSGWVKKKSKEICSWPTLCASWISRLPHNLFLSSLHSPYLGFHTFAPCLYLYPILSAVLESNDLRKYLKQL